MAKEVNFETNKIVNGSNLMLNNKDLTTWNSPLILLENGHYMFKGCEKMSSFSTDEYGGISLQNIKDASYMFEDSGFTGGEFYTSTEYSPMPFTQCTNMEGMFKDCKKLGSISIQNGSECPAQSFEKTFYNCGKDIGEFQCFFGL